MTNKQGYEEIIKVNSNFGKYIGFTLDKFEKCSYIIKIGKDLILSNVFDKTNIKEKEEMLRKLLMYNHNISIPIKNTKKLIHSIFNKSFNCIVPEFVYYDKMLKDLGFMKMYVYEEFFNGYIALWVKRAPRYIVNKTLPSRANIESHRKNIQTFNYYTQEVLGLTKLYLIDWFLEKGKSIKLEKKGFFEIPENLVKIRLNYLKKKGFVIFDKKTKTYKCAPTKKERFITEANPIRYCQKKCVLDVATVISHFYKGKPKEEAIFNKPDLNKEINVI